MWALICGIQDLIPFTGMEPGPPALGVMSLSHWTSREVPGKLALESSFILSGFMVIEMNYFSSRSLALGESPTSHNRGVRHG